MMQHFPVWLGLAACLAGAAHAQTALRTGSGFAVSDATHIVTNAHVVEGCRSLRVLLGGRAEPARLLATDTQADLALLQTSVAMPRLALRASPAVRLGESVIAFGFPLAGSLSQEGNLTTGNVSALAGLRDDPQYLQMTAPVQPGNSGGPLLDEAGHVIGVITAKLDAVSIARRTGDIPQNVNFAVKAGVLEDFLQRNRVAYDKQATDRRLAVADIAESAKAASVRIECSARGATTVQPAPAPPQAQSEPAAPPPARPAPTPAGSPAAIAEGARGRIVQAVRVIEVATPYPTTSPGLRALTIANDSPASLYRVTIGWMNQEVAHCPAAAAAYAGKRDVMVSIKPGEVARTLATFPASARAFCVLDAALAPQPPAPASPAPGEARPPSASEVPRESAPAPASPEPGETPP
jgi:S1-C subfamily serine protease